eukprot:TRINITY_DN39136_c0_g1_i3.p1 TRINITY_DN39136_c0_g1~~TRINITY_DN39136_c0_g1_i3.p1  ORF type:complete len:542 (+),score=126.31 TRINITY_DN39136_c0_g1_i3:139-1764(+)
MPVRATVGEEKSKGAVFGSYSTAKEGALAAIISEPGSLIGEEALLFDGLREQLAAKVANTVRLQADSSFYVADITTFRLLSQCLGTTMQDLAEKVGERLGRRGAQLGRSQVAAKQLDRLKKRLQKRELARLERQQVRLPPSSGTSGVIELDHVDDWLKVVLEGRRPPPNERDPTTLSLLESLKIDAFTKLGPGVEAVRKIYSDPNTLKDHQSDLLRIKRGGGQRKVAQSSNNPIGDTVSPHARYEEVLPAEILDAAAAAQLALQEGSTGSASGSASGGIFFQTEPEFDETQPTVSVHWSQASLTKSSSVPVLPRLKNGADEELDERSTMFEARHTTASGFGGTRSSFNTRSSGPALESGATVSKRKRDPQAIQAQKIMKAFHKAIAGKSVLILTDKVDVRRAIMRGLMSAANEMDMCFVKSTSELWIRMRDAKEQHHGLIVDLQKQELDVESLVRTVRAHERYGQIPIVVLSKDWELPNLVRQSCSFVVFHPIAASMLREALLWCFDRASVQASFDTSNPLAVKDSAQASGLSVIGSVPVR